MQRIVRPVLAFAILVVAACQSQSESASLDTENQKASYGIGLQMGAQLQPAESRIDMDAFLAGLRDGMAGEEPTIPQAEIQVALQAFSEAINEEETQRRAAVAEENTAQGETFLAENAAREGVVVTESGLQYEVIREGEGARPGPSGRTPR